ncbi:MAG: Spx/MgsR family RNA polymerase-binding regulatory protein [Opitutae bacterium]|nr:Spx/MgsR family RNA polymerase-binding regulatory protein [Opitutae bacterium]
MSAPLTVYAYAKCSTCRDAAQWLRAHRVEFVERPIYEQAPAVAELRRMLAFQGGNLRRLFNTSGIQYRERGLAAKLPAMAESDALALLASDGRLVKRPFLLGERVGLLGFDAEAWTAALTKVKIPGASSGAFEKTSANPFEPHAIHTQSRSADQAEASFRVSDPQRMIPFCRPSRSKLQGIGPTANEMSRRGAT